MTGTLVLSAGAQRLEPGLDDFLVGLVGSEVVRSAVVLDAAVQRVRDIDVWSHGFANLTLSFRHSGCASTRQLDRLAVIPFVQLSKRLIDIETNSRSRQ